MKDNTKIGKVIYNKSIVFTANDVIELIHECNAYSLREISDYVEQFRPDTEDLVKLLRVMADELEAQAMVVSLRDKLWDGRKVI